MSEASIAVLGYGGHAHEVATYTSNPVVFYAVDHDYLSGDLVDLENPNKEQLSCPVVAAVGTPLLKKEMIRRWPGRVYANVVSGKSNINSDVKMGVGIQIAPQAVIMPSCTLGDHVSVNVSATISHNCKIGDYTTISPGVNIAGNVEIGEGVFIGIGAIISNNVKIASGCVIGAGTVVLENITTENSVVVGVPGKVIKVNEDWLSEI